MIHGDWTPWNGADHPLKGPVNPDTVVEVRTRAGIVQVVSAGIVGWMHYGEPSDIVEYKLYKHLELVK
jgi:hypothetical protein